MINKQGNSQASSYKINHRYLRTATQMSTERGILTGAGEMASFGRVYQYKIPTYLWKSVADPLALTQKRLYVCL